MPINKKRIHALNQSPDSGGPVLYWMSREQRVSDNWGLLHARELAGEDRALVVGFCLVPTFLGATRRQYDFMLRGLREVSTRLDDLGVPFVLRVGDPAVEIVRLVAELEAGVVVTDFDPLRIKQAWQREVARALCVSMVEVDGHNIVPARHVSDKQEYSARTIRPKIHRLLPEFLEDVPSIRPLQGCHLEIAPPDWRSAEQALDVNETVGPVSLVAGERVAHKALGAFVHERLGKYTTQSNDPVGDVTSRLSAYLHFGQLSAQRVARTIVSSGAGKDHEAFLEQLVVRRELSDNFCLYNAYYDSLRGAPDWALASLEAHRDDPRAFNYGPEEFEQARTHSGLWNAAQQQMLNTGFMHGYMRMYWAKKILEWSASPEVALETIIVLNDRYQLDGRDPNGYVGALWSVAGLHDRPWKQRPVFGSIRYMNENGCRRKFDVEAYIKRWDEPDSPQD